MSGDQYIRKCSIVVSTAVGNGIDVAGLRCTFNIKKSFAQTPNVSTVRIYNLAKDTANQIKKEFSRIVVQAGYESNYGLISDGNIKQVKQGKENGTDTYLDIAAGDGDRAYQYATVSKTLAAGVSPSDVIKAASAPMAAKGLTVGAVPSIASGATLPRAKVLYGSSRDHLRQAAASAGLRWSIQDGGVQIVQPDQMIPGMAVEISPESGLIGSPEETKDGVTFKALLNPILKVNGPVLLKGTEYDGSYKILALEYTGDTRGNDWYVSITGKAQ